MALVTVQADNAKASRKYGKGFLIAKRVGASMRQPFLNFAISSES
jgi:hypothetical protein